MSAAFVARESALSFPTGGAHWPGMGEELDESPLYRGWVDRAELALLSLGAERGALRRLMAGDNQGRRLPTDDGWVWTGDFPLSVAAQTVLGACLGHAFEASFGAPAVVVGESMGECAAYCVSGALSLEDSVRFAYQWAKSLHTASNELGLRMAVLENLEEQELLEAIGHLDPRIVVIEAPALYVVSLPARHLGELQRIAYDRDVNMLVSNNPCGAHDPRLGERHEVWADFDRFLDSLHAQPPRLPMMTALHPGARLESETAVRDNLRATTTTQVRWSETISLLPSLGVRTIVQLGVPGRAYALERLRSREPRLKGIGLRPIKTLSALGAVRADSAAPPAPES